MGQEKKLGLFSMRTTSMLGSSFLRYLATVKPAHPPPHTTTLFPLGGGSMASILPALSAAAKEDFEGSADTRAPTPASLKRSLLLTLILPPPFGCVF
jgi:hypothetical protein